MNRERTHISNDEAKRMLDAGESIENAVIDRISVAKKKYANPITIIECTIETLDLNRCEFEQLVTIRRCKIKHLILRSAVFHDKCDFKGSRLTRCKASRAKFEGGLKCDSAELHASFFKAEFHKKVEFGWSTFHGELNLADVVIRGDLDFRYAHVKGEVKLEGAECHGRAVFSHVSIDGALKCRDTKWHDELKLNFAQIGLDADFFGSKLGASTDLSNTSVGRKLNFGNVELGDLQEFWLTGVVASSYNLGRNTVEGRIAPERVGKWQAAIREYSFLRSTFQSINQFEDEDWAYYQLRRMERKSLSWANPITAVRRFFNWLFVDLSCGYGTKPFRALGACALIMLAFAVLFFFSIGPSGSPHDYGFSAGTNNVIYALDTSITAFSGDYSGAELQGKWRIAGMIEFLMGIVYLGLFIVAFSRKVIR